MPEAGQSYIHRLCDALIDEFSHASKGTKDRLAGYVANFDFWVSETEHRIALIKTYESRFKRFSEGQQAVADTGDLKWNERSDWTPPPSIVQRSTNATERKEIRNKVIQAFTQFVDRCVHDKLIDDQTRTQAIRRIQG